MLTDEQISVVKDYILFFSIPTQQSKFNEVASFFDVMSPQEEFEWDFLARTRSLPDDSREVRRVLRALYISKFLTADEYVAAVDALKVAP